MDSHVGGAKVWRGHSPEEEMIHQSDIHHSLILKVFCKTGTGFFPEMASEDVGKLTGYQIFLLVFGISEKAMRKIAERYMNISKERINDLEFENRSSKGVYNFNRAVIREWVKQNPFNQRKVSQSHTKH